MIESPLKGVRPSSSCKQWSNLGTFLTLKLGCHKVDGTDRTVLTLWLSLVFRSLSVSRACDTSRTNCLDPEHPPSASPQPGKSPKAVMKRILCKAAECFLTTQPTLQVQGNIPTGNPIPLPHLSGCSKDTLRKCKYTLMPQTRRLTSNASNLTCTLLQQSKKSRQGVCLVTATSQKTEIRHTSAGPELFPAYPHYLLVSLLNCVADCLCLKPWTVPSIPSYTLTHKLMHLSSP